MLSALAPHANQRLYQLRQAASIRGFSLFNKVPGGSSSQNETAFNNNPVSQQRTSEEISRSIEQYKQSIRLKTQSGVSLSRSIGAQVEPDRHRKLQRYEIFIDKMQRLYKSEMRYQRKQASKIRAQENAIVYSQTPLKDIMIAYNELANTPRGGFNAEAVTATLSNLSKAIRVRGYKGRPQGDYSISELDQSWRMSRLVEDIQFGLREDQFFSPHLLAQVSLNLGELSYKNTELIPQIFKKLQAQLAERFEAASFEQTSLDFNDAVYGGTVGHVSRHYIFKGFQDNKEFHEYMQILMEWEGEAGAETALEGAASKSQAQLSAEAEELQQAMGELINAAVQVKEFQQEYQSSIDNLRTQFFQMSEASDKHAFLQENQYIKYDLLELQEMLVKGGYIEPDETSAVSALATEPFDQRMQRASDIFYDYVVNYAPELISPQYNSFYEAASKSLPKQAEIDPSLVKENQNVINLSTLSQTLVGLSEQALSYRRDVNLKDYLNKFYEEYLMPHEQKLYNHDPKEEMQHIKSDNIFMERGYLLAWQQFKEGASQVLPRLRELVRADKDSLEGQLHALSALNACRFEEKELRKDIIDNALRLISQPGQEIDQAAVVSGLHGLADSPSNSQDKVRQLASKLAERLDFSKLTSFTQQLNALWSLCALQQYEARSLAQGLRQINQLNFERVDTEVKYEEFQKLADIYNALKFESPVGSQTQNANNKSLQLTNPGLLLALQNQQVMNNLRYIETHTKFDPFKQRVVQALTKGLTSASVEHQVIQENELFETQVLDAEILNASKYPYKPDIIMGYKGQKVGVFVLPETSTTRDTFQASGAQQFRQRLLQHLNPSIKVAALPITQVVDYDIAGLRIDLRRDFKFNSLLESQIGQPSQGIDFSILSAFGSSFVQQAAGYIETLGLTNAKEASKLDSLVQRLYQTLQIKQQAELRFEDSQKAAGYDEIRFSLMKLSLLYDSLTKESKNFVDAFATPAATDFKTLLQATLAQIPRNQLSTRIEGGIDAGWLGTRLDVELPVSATEDVAIKKSIVPEMINQRLMWVEDYFHYDDWKTKQKEVFDNFNLLVVPQAPTAEQSKFFFDQDTHHRRIPQGVFPYPNHKRQLMLPSANHTLVDILSNPHHDDYVRYEKEPMKMMVINELSKSQQLKPIDDDTSMITNLLNIKQGLKADFSDAEIVNTILSNLSFTEQLIEEHLGKAAKKGAEVKYVPRDAQKYRDFVASTYHSKDREDPFTHFYLKESKTKEYINKLIADEKDLKARVEEGSADFTVIEEGKRRREALSEKIENMLLAEERINEDVLQITTQLRTTVNVKYDMKTLVKSEFIYDVEPELLDPSLTDEQYLTQSRIRAEAKLIKLKLIYKLYNSQELTANEKSYLKQWVADVKQGKGRNLLNLRDSMLPKQSTQLTVNALDAKSLYSLNSISRVNIDRERHGNYALSDLILELSHFLDEDVVNKVETEIFSDRMRKEWGLSKDFKAVESRNKEIGLVLNELEELAWRSAGQLDQSEVGHIESMLSVKRGKDYFDQQFFSSDIESFRTFVAQANDYDARIELIERWVVRKEDEIKARVQLPPEALKKSDQRLHELIDAPLKQAREKLAAKLLVADEFGNPLDTAKQYQELTSRELHSLAENLSLRLYLFNYDYPAFLPQVMRAVIEHPNLLKSDRDQLELYARMFEVDWRGDRSVENKVEFMATNPIYIEGTNIKSYGSVTDEVVKEKLKRACAPYVEEAARRVMTSA